MKPQTAQTSSFLLVTSWAKHQVQHKRPVTKKRILCVIKRFRLHPNLPFLGSRKLPHHLDSACAPYVGCSSEPAFPNRPRSPSKDRHSIEKQDGRNKQNQIIQLSPHDQTVSQQHTDTQAKRGYQHQAFSVHHQSRNCLTLASIGGNTFRSKNQQESRQRNPCHRSAIFSHSVKYCFLHYGGVRKQVKRKN
jgi:hypothetical protein